MSAITMSGRPEAARIAETAELFAPFLLLLMSMLFIFTAAGERAIGVSFEYVARHCLYVGVDRRRQPLTGRR